MTSNTTSTNLEPRQQQLQQNGSTTPTAPSVPVLGEKIKRENSSSSTIDSSDDDLIAHSNGRPSAAIEDSTRHDLEKATTSTSQRSNRSTGYAETRSVLSRIRSRRQDIGEFSHPLMHHKTGQDVLVDFDGPDDPYRPLNWPFRKKVITTVLYGLVTMGSTWASSVYSPGVEQVAAEYGVGVEVSTLGLSFLLLGFGLGPLLFGPLSELYGRRKAVFIPYFIAAIFSFATGACENIQGILICRFFTGIFASAPVTNTGGVLGDIWAPEQRGVAIVGYAMAVVVGPCVAPVVGGAIVMSHLGWRWTQFITGILMLVVLFLAVLLTDETYAPVLLEKKAQKLRIKTGNWALHSKHEEWDVGIKEIAEKYLIRPFQLLATPICLFIAVYASFCYGILYL
jgi:multidrug resistance protein